MKTRALLEMSVESLEAAVLAVRGGADRLELCENLSVGGVTPGATLMREARKQIAVPIFAMIRPRGGDFVYNVAEFEEIKRQIGVARGAGMDGVVFGILTRDRQVDVARNSVLVKLAAPLPVTFHRAFDTLVDLVEGLEDVIAAGATRVLTSGGAVTAEEGCGKLAALVRQAGKRITILPGGGIRPGNLRRIMWDTVASEYHSGLSHARRKREEFESGVRELSRVLQEEAGKLQGSPARR
jgi:copper homeostasis protein